jgi:hypothetical protein
MSAIASSKNSFLLIYAKLMLGVEIRDTWKIGKPYFAGCKCIYRK